jgi:protein required for attachment to host cells
MTKSTKKEQGSPAADVSEQTWVVVADGRKARVFRREKSGELELLDQIISTRDHHLKHKPPHIDAIHPDDAAFIKEVGEWLALHCDSDAFDHLVLVASPKNLPYFRQSFSQPLQARLKAELDKDIAHLEDHEVCKELCDIMWF